MTPKFRLKGAGFFENNFKKLKALLKNILHVKGSEAILDFKGTFFLKKVVFKTFSVLNPSTHRISQLQHPISPQRPTQSTDTSSGETASVWQTGNRILQVTETVGKTTVCCRACLLLSVKSSRASIRVECPGVHHT